ncbi:unnamed protein product, partial [Ectocarpus sp. 12 AP-2014]
LPRAGRLRGILCGRTAREPGAVRRHRWSLARRWNGGGQALPGTREGGRSVRRRWPDPPYGLGHEGRPCVRCPAAGGAAHSPHPSAR